MPGPLPNLPMTISQNLSKLWLKEVHDDRIRAPYFTANGAKGFWGVHMEGSEPGFYEEDVCSHRRAAGIVKRRLDNGFFIMLHPFRLSRPGVKPHTAGRPQDLPFESLNCAFGCQDPTRTLSLLTRSPIAQFKGAHFSWNIYPNAAPVHAGGHFIWVRSTQLGVTSVLPHTGQFLNLEALEDFLSIAQSLSGTMLFFNSLHAGATVNHLHFQSIFHCETFAVEVAPHSEYEKYTTLNQYPAIGLVFGLNAPAFQIWSSIELLQQCGIAYNLLAIGGCVYLLPRNPASEVVPEFPSGVFASLELAGMIITGDKDTFEAITTGMVMDAIKRVALPLAKFEELFGDIRGGLRR